MLRRSLNLNSQKIVNHFAEQKLARMKAGQRAKMEREEILKNGPPIELPIKDVLRRHEGILRVRGMINGLGVLEKMRKAVGFRCEGCDNINVKFDYTNSRPRFSDETPRIEVSKMRCERCQSESDQPPFYHEPWDDPVNALKIVLSDTETYNEVVSLNVTLLYDYTRNIQTGEQVIVTGSLQRITSRGQTLPHLFVGLYPIKDVEAAVEYVNKKESVKVNDDDEKAVREFLAKNKGKELDALVKLVAPSIVGYEDVKKGLLLSLASSGKDAVRRKRRLHSLLIGDPGLAKSYLAEYMVRLAGGNSAFASAVDSSPKSLVGVFDNDEKILRLGPIPRSHGSICSIDEIGRMSPQDQGLILTSMQQGVIYFGRYAFNPPLQASTTFVLTCNPAGNSGKLNAIYEKVKVFDHEYPIIGPLRDRIDFFFVFRTDRNMNKAMNYSLDKIRIEDNYEAIIREEEENIKFLQKLNVLAHRLDPKFSTEARHVIQRFYAEVFSAKDSKYSPRLLDTLNNACYAVARIKLKEIVDVDDAKEVAAFFKTQIEQHQSQIVTVPHDPRDLAVEEIIKQLTGSNFKYQWTELLDSVCKKDDDSGRWVSKYIGEIFALKNKKKLRHIRTRLKEYASSHKDKILTLSISPLTLAWRETYTGGDSAIDIDKVADPEDIEEPLTPTSLTTPTPTPTPTTNDDRKEEELKGTQGIQGTYDGTVGTIATHKTVPEVDGTPISAQSALSAIPSSSAVEDETSIAQRIHELNQEGKSQRQIAKIVDISKSAVNRVLKTSQETETAVSRSVGQSETQTANPEIGENEPSEDYEAYVSRQKKIFDPKTSARQIFDELVSKNAEANPSMERGVLESEYREALISSGFSDDDIDITIKGMENDRIIERVGTELDGVICDILRVIN
jgi:DNA replicative helicase MCM subunit Mcm2 (Cdc46/Mcm family)/predicted transcriptional regulator